MQFEQAIAGFTTECFLNDGLIADKLLQRQRAEVEAELEGLNDIGCNEVILKGVM